MVALNDAACLGLTGERIDPDRYVECVLEGPGPYRRRMRQRHSEARERSKTATTAQPR
jgi:hypothetical protein